MSNELVKDQRKQEIIKAVTELDFYSALPAEIDEIKGKKRIQITEIATLGLLAEPIMSLMSSAGGSGLYRVIVPEGKKLVKFTSKDAFTGALSNGNNSVGDGMAELKPLKFTPEMASQACLAVAMLGLEHRLNEIKRSQDAIIEFVEKKDQYMLKGSLYFLLDMLSNYKFNYDNEEYKKTNHIKVLDVKESAEQSINQYSDLVKSLVDKQQLIHFDRSVNEKLKRLQGYFKSYQVALYNYAFSSFLDVILLGNFDSEFLEAITKKIEKYSIEYREIYTEAYNKIEAYNDKAVETVVLKGVAKAGNTVGNKIKGVKRLDKFGQEVEFAAKAVKQFNQNKKDDILDKVISNKTNYALPFINGINYLSKVYNCELKILVDKDNLYLEEAIA